VFPDGTRGSVNLCVPSGRAGASGGSWGNLDYDVNLMLADKAFDKNGQPSPTSSTSTGSSWTS